MEALIKLGMALVLLSLGFIYGSRNEARHFKSIRKREEEQKDFPTTNFKTIPSGYKVESSMLAMGSTVVSVDYFKRFLAGFTNLIGGRMTSYESLVDRARREAILRMKEHAKGHDLIINLRVETSSISKGAAKSIGSIEVLAYGTALKVLK